MAFLKKQALAEPVSVPSKSEAHAEYRLQNDRFVALNEQLRSLHDEEAALVAAITADKTPSLRPGVAALLGEEQSPKADKVSRLKEVRSLAADIDEAIVIVGRRLRDLETAASIAVFHVVRPEVSKRMSALLQALETVDEARRGVDEIVLAIEAEGAETSLLGQLRTSALVNQIAVFRGQAREAGYV